MPHRGCESAKATSAATAPGSAIASGFTFSTYSPDVEAIPRLTFAESESGRGFSSTRTPVGTRAHRARHVGDDDDLVDLWGERG